jgi:hypothetical protein
VVLGQALPDLAGLVYHVASSGHVPVMWHQCPCAQVERLGVWTVKQETYTGNRW